MILVTGANGKTGRAVIKALLPKGERIRAFVHRAEQVPFLQSLGDLEVVAGDMMAEKAVHEAFIGVRAVYHICSAMNPHEVEIGEIATNAARKAGVDHFVYHSVLHPVLQDMPHHQKKLVVEALVVDSGIPYTIVQPAVFMQNILESWKPLREEGVFRQKFFTGQKTRICMVDLEDVAEAVSLVLAGPGHEGATYELCGPENLSLPDMTAAMGGHLARDIRVETIPDHVFAAMLRKSGAGDYQVDTLLKMFRHYNEQGFLGNSNVLSFLLGRKPHDFAAFLQRTMESGQ